MSVWIYLKHFDTVNLRLRAISAAILVPITLLAVWIGGLVYAGFAACVVIVGLYEWLRLVGPNMRARIVAIALAMLLAIMATGELLSPPFGAMIGVFCTLALFFLAARDGEDRSGWVALGIPYMGGAGLALLALRQVPDIGAALTLYLVLVVWGTDVGAFVAGRIIGGPKLAPDISPSKTWAGLVGGMALALVMGYAAAWALGAHRPLIAAALAPLLAVIAQLGDLFESYFKRRSGVKESGDLIPGHGGVLDRIDGLVVAAMFTALFEAAVGPQLQWW
ncbi:MAG: phosphatidate cytidylyltransferase [Alphaproteobacteria bacterium]|nr:phosphatidate cytidylyltransferase [Alphaproteobacteria bacterium]